MIRRQHVVQEFFDRAGEMRASLDSRFRDPYRNGIKWDYFCDPQVYTYLRTDARSALSTDLFDQFLLQLRSWCLENLGLVPKGPPTLHLMVDGCRLGLHSDFHNGALGYVFSLTHWDRRRFSGGETLLLRDGIPSYKKHHVDGDVLYELVPARFNQLLVFDDRLVHATPVIEGSMDPVEGRIALVGHIVAGSPIVDGHLPSQDTREVVLRTLRTLKEKLKTHQAVQGTITFRLLVSAAGRVRSATVLADTLVTPSTGYEMSEEVEIARGLIEQTLMEMMLPRSAGESSVAVPILIPLPDVEPIRVEILHDAPVKALRESMARCMEIENDSVLHGAWRDLSCDISAPVAGAVSIEPRRVRLDFDPPMWVPSQRAAFQNAVTAWARGAVDSVSGT